MFCFDVTIFDQVHDMDTIHELRLLLHATASGNLF